MNIRSERPKSATTSGSADWLLFVAFIPCIITAAIAMLVVPQFRELYLQFGADLPNPTALLFAGYRWLWLSCLVPLAAWSLWPNRANRGAAAIVVGALLSALLIAVGAWALYLPLMLLQQQTG